MGASPPRGRSSLLSARSSWSGSSPRPDVANHPARRVPEHGLEGEPAQRESVEEGVRDARERPFRVCDNNAPDSVEDLELLGQPDPSARQRAGQDVERGRYDNPVRSPHRSNERGFVRMRIQQDDVAVVTNIREHLIELLLRWRLVIEAPM